MGVTSNAVRRLTERGNVALPLCRIRLDFPNNDVRRATDVVFDLSLGPEPRGSISIAASDIGIPLRYSEARALRTCNYRLPEILTSFIGQALPADRPLYLAFDSPYGYLPAVPWETLATPVLGRPVLRLGTVAVRPMLREQVMDIAYCCSLPESSCISSAVLATEFLKQVPTEFAQAARFHVFTHRRAAALLDDRVRAIGLSDNVAIYSPTQATICAFAQDTECDLPDVARIQNPWLLWMRDALQNVSVDVVHFACMGYLGRSRAGLRLADVPADRGEIRCSEIVAPRELAMFLQQVGAWAIAFSSPQFNTCDLGLRMLFHEISGLIAGPAAVHDIAADVDKAAVGMLYRYMLAPQSSPTPVSPALALATNPGWLGAVNQQWDDRMEHFVREYTLFGRAENATSPSPAPAAPSWVTSQQRILEKSVAELAAAPQSPTEQAREDGILEALKFTTSLLAQHAAQKAQDDGTPSGDATP